MNYDLDYLEAMQNGNSDRLFLRLAIVGHSTLSCPITNMGLDVDRDWETIEIIIHCSGSNLY